MSVRVRMAPSPTGFLHVGTARTFLFNWLFARREGGECLLRIENTDMNREVEGAAKQINILRALGADIPLYAHMPDVAGEDGKKLSKRHGAQSLDEFRDMGYYAPALMNFLALLGWSYDDKTTIMSKDELIERFSLDRVVPSPATFDYEKLDWLNGVYLRALSPQEYADVIIDYLGPTWDAEKVRRIAPLVQEKLTRL